MVDGGWTKKDQKLGATAGRMGSGRVWKELVPRSHRGADWRQRGEQGVQRGQGEGSWKVILEKEAIFKSCGGCECNRGLRFHYLLIFLCVYVYTYMLCVWGCICACVSICVDVRRRLALLFVF